MNNLLQKIPLINSARRNHSLEHATLQVLEQKYPGLRMAGVSFPPGFCLVGDLPTELVTEAVIEAQQRLGLEPELAIHPNCGTNLVTSSLLSGAATFLVLWGLSGKRKPTWISLITSILVAVPVFILSRPLGPRIQKSVTTDLNLENWGVKLVESRKTRQGFVHFIHTGKQS